jgi:hypothetical protein
MFGGTSSTDVFPAGLPALFVHRRTFQREHTMSDNHDNLELVLDVIEGRLQGERADAVMARVAVEPEWRDVYRWANDFVHGSEGLTVQPVPASTRAMLERLLPARRAAAQQIGDVVRTFARLVRDVPSGQAFAGARGAAATRRQVMFEVTSDTDLVLEIETTDGALAIAGQLLGEHSHIAVEITSATGVQVVALDDLGEFTLSLPPTAFVYLDLLGTEPLVTVDLTALIDPPVTPT